MKRTMLSTILAVAFLAGVGDVNAGLKENARLQAFRLLNPDYDRRRLNEARGGIYFTSLFYRSASDDTTKHFEENFNELVGRASNIQYVLCRIIDVSVVKTNKVNKKAFTLVMEFLDALTDELDLKVVKKGMPMLRKMDVFTILKKCLSENSDTEK